MAATVSNTVPVSVKVGGRLPISLETTVDSDVHIKAKVPVRLGTVSIQKSALGVKLQ